MNTDTGAIYRTKAEIEAAIERGEPVVPVSELVADLMEAGQRVKDLGLLDLETRVAALEEKLAYQDQVNRISQIRFVTVPHPEAWKLNGACCICEKSFVLPNPECPNPHHK